MYCYKPLVTFVYLLLWCNTLSPFLFVAPLSRDALSRLVPTRVF